MIQVQIASQITATGVDGIRWVLVEPPDGPQASVAAAPSTPSDGLAAAALPPATGAVDTAAASVHARTGLTLTLLKLLVLGLGVGLAMLMAQASFGPAAVRWLAPVRDAGPASGQLPGDAMPLPASPPPAASAVPMVTAELR
jgi:hypothetical protein